MRVIILAAVLAVILSGPLPVLAQTPAGPASDAGNQASTRESAQETARDAGQVPADAARTLAEILQDPAARQALIDRLLAEAGAASPPTADAAPPAGASAPAPSLAREVAEYTRDVAEGVSAFVTRLTRSVLDVASIFTGERRVNWDRLTETLLDLAVVAAATLAGFWILRGLAARAFRAMARRAADAGWVRRIAMLLGSNAVDALSILLAWGAGYAVALSLGGGGHVNVQQSLFLNAFLLVEMAKVVLRGILAPRFDELRWLPMSGETARHWYFWASRVVDVLGYGLLLVVPVVNGSISYVVGRSLRLLIVLLAALIALAVILRNRAPVRRAMQARNLRLPDDLTGRILAMLAKVWHLIAIVYLVALVAIWVTRPSGALGFMVGATVESAIAVGLGTLIVVLITKTIAGGIRLPDEVKLQLPLLEGRLNAFIPNVLKVVRVVILIGVVLTIGQAWEIHDFLAWLASETGRDLSGRTVAAAAVLMVAAAIWIAVSSWIEYRLNPNVGRLPTARERTLLSLFRNAFMIALLVIALMLSLSELGVNIGPLLAGAGVLGLAIGFGAQKLVQDIITGAFIQIENAMNEGDVVTIAGISGVVERLTIRSVGLRDLAGTYHLIPFSSVDSVSNFMRGFAYHVAEIGVAYREKVGEVKQLMQVAFERLKETEHGANIVADLEMHGVTALADSAVVVRARIKTLPGSQWAVGRAYTEIVKEVLDEAGVEIPFPHMTLYMGEDKTGSAPPLRVQQLPPGGPPPGESPPEVSPLEEPPAGEPEPGRPAPA